MKLEYQTYSGGDPFPIGFYYYKTEFNYSFGFWYIDVLRDGRFVLRFEDGVKDESELESDGKYFDSLEDAVVYLNLIL